MRKNRICCLQKRASITSNNALKLLIASSKCFKHEKKKERDVVRNLKCYVMSQKLKYINNTLSIMQWVVAYALIIVEAGIKCFGLSRESHYKNIYNATQRL